MMRKAYLQAWEIHAIEKMRRAERLAREERARARVEIREVCGTCSGSGCERCSGRGTREAR